MCEAFSDCAGRSERSLIILRNWIVCFHLSAAHTLLVMSSHCCRSMVGIVNEMSVMNCHKLTSRIGLLISYLCNIVYWKSLTFNCNLFRRREWPIIMLDKLSGHCLLVDTHFPNSWFEFSINLWNVRQLSFKAKTCCSLLSALRNANK